jgi:hypothetical protein
MHQINIFGLKYICRLDRYIYDMYIAVSQMYLEFSMVAKLAMLEQQFLAVPDESNKYF